MNSVPAGTAGRVARICVENGEFAPLGTTLMLIEPDMPRPSPATPRTRFLLLPLDGTDGAIASASASASCCYPPIRQPQRQRFLLLSARRAERRPTI